MIKTTSHLLTPRTKEELIAAIPAPDLNRRELQWKDVCAIQDLLNINAVPNTPDWRLVRTTNEYLFAALMEYAEFNDSFQWKWWGKQDTKLDNAKVEVADMLHFIASYFILNESEYYQSAAKHLPMVVDVEPEFEHFNADGKVNLRGALDRVHSFTEFGTNYGRATVISDLSRACGMSNVELSAYYIAKVALNEIRWEGGYYLGAYKKLKAGDDKNKPVEDNTYLHAIVAEFMNTPTMPLADVSIKVRLKIKAEFEAREWVTPLA